MIVLQQSPLIEPIGTPLVLLRIRMVLSENYSLIARSIDSGTRWQRRSGQRFLEKQRRILEASRPGSNLAKINSMVAGSKKPLHQAFLDLVRTIDKNLLTVLSSSMGWSSAYFFAARLLEDERRADGEHRAALSLTKRLLPVKNKLTGGSSQIALWVHALLSMLAGFFCASKVDGRNNP